jgi:hypothetical protein
LRRFSPIDFAGAVTAESMPVVATGTWMKPILKIRGRWAYLYRVIDRDLSGLAPGDPFGWPVYRW